MDARTTHAHTLRARLLTLFHKKPKPAVDDPLQIELALHCEMLSADQRAEHSKALATTHKLKPGHSRSRLLAQLAENEQALFDIHALLADDIEADTRLSPAGEWLLDNFYVIEEQIRTARKHLPKKYYQELPHLANTALAGLPRVYAISLAAVSYNDGRMVPENLCHMVTAYQSVTVLSLGELWAIPIMLRLALLDKIRSIAGRIAASRIDRISASTWADQMISIVADEPKNLILSVADMARATPVLTSSFVAEFIRRLRGLGPTLALPLTWLEQRLSENEMTIEKLVRLENQFQAANQISMSNCIVSLRVLDATKWQDFVEATSHVEQTLRHDPASMYSRMDFATRDQYRHVVEKLAKRSACSEQQIAASALELAQASLTAHAAAQAAPLAQNTQAAQSSQATQAALTEHQAPRLQPAKTAGLESTDTRSTHVGYYLLGDGLSQLEKLISASVSLPTALHRRCSQKPLPFYVGGIAVLAALFASSFVVSAQHDGASTLMLCVVAVFGFLGGGHLALSMVNWIATMLVTPRPLPRLDFLLGIDPNLRTLVAIPAMLSSVRDIEKLIVDLEIRFLSNRDAHIHFALLTDFSDAPQEKMPEDNALLETARVKIMALNRKYAHGAGASFLLLHRPRVWNEQECVWMGYERKRGKLADLNAFLRDGRRDRFMCVVGNTTELSHVKYVVTLDTDTLLARDTVRQFVGIMAHPLNRPVYDAQQHRVVAGYGILQPRVVSSLLGSNRSRFAQMTATDSGIDPYTRATSDVYQDLFGEGSYIGKGIYDVDIFERAVGKHFPENRILSHDLLEGCYARSGLASDVHLYEESPLRYGMDAMRRHRWIRGDWQIARWIWPTIPGADGRTMPNTLSALARWKIFDNLRRSLVAPALLGLLLFGWGLSASPLLWTLAVMGLTMLPSLVQSAVGMMRKSSDMTLRQHLVGAVCLAPRQWSQAGLSLVCLPYEAFFSADAIVRTFWRTLVSHRKMLEWNPSASDRLHDKAGLCDALRRMWIGPVLAVVGGIVLAMHTGGTAARVLVGGLLLCWLLSPLLVWWLGQPKTRRSDPLSDKQHAFLRKLARKTWAFFEKFVGPADNWLPPDNYQQHPVERIAHRTSPTNVGLALLANQAAHDFGALTGGEFLDRTENSFQTMSLLERYRGHFFNWYDTQTLAPLAPLYVSSVDSGNLAGHLLSLRSGLAELRMQPILGEQLFLNLHDTLSIAHDLVLDTVQEGKKEGPQEGAALLFKQLRLQVHELANAVPVTLLAMHTAVMQLCSMTEKIEIQQDNCACARPLTQLENEHRCTQCLPVDCLLWVRSFERQCRALLDELQLLCPWISWIKASSSLHYVDSFPELNTIPSLHSLEALRLPDLPDLAHSTGLAQQADVPQQDFQTTQAAPYCEAELEQLRTHLATGTKQAQERLRRIGLLREKCDVFSRAEYDFLYDDERQLLRIGYTVNEHRADAGFYDLLASEARLASFVAIAQGALPQENWFALGRLLTSSGGEPILLSWSGSMFEYLMPLLVMPGFENTLLDETCKAAVSRQIAYGKQCNVPWGVSECGYNTFDAASNYQYRAFGVPGLGLKRGLAADLVIAPYASALALMVAPGEACANLERLAASGFEGRYGMYEAIDYTASRLPRGQSCAVVRSFMAHHQGMSLLALNHLLLHAPMQRRFAADPQCQATMLLLQERVPELTATYAHTSVRLEHKRQADTLETPLRMFSNADTPHPEVQLLSNGTYHVMLTHAGGGYSRWKNLAVTRWNEDSTRDHWGSFCYIKDMDSEAFWSTTYQPLCATSGELQAIFSEGKAEYSCRVHDYDVHTEIVVSSEDDVELRRLRMTNLSTRQRTVEITSFSEVVLAPPVVDDLHPSFSKLFVHTQIVPDQHAILCSRRPRSEHEQTPWALHTMAVHGDTTATMSYETDRSAFIGRGRTAANPQAMASPWKNNTVLSGSEGSVLDPALSIRAHLTLEPEQTITVDMIYGIGEDRETALNLVNKYRDRHIADRVFDMTWTHSQVLLRQMNASEADAQLYAQLAGSIIYPNASLRAAEDIVASNRRGQSGLWGYAISGDLPIVLCKIEHADNLDLVRHILQAHEYWRLKGLSVDLVIWNEDQAGYRQVLHDQIIGLITAGNGGDLLDRPGGIFVRAADRIAEEDRTLIQTVARLILSDAQGSLAEHIQRPHIKKRGVPLLLVPEHSVTAVPVVSPQARPDLVFFNGLGGFTPDGREYVITTAADSPRSQGQLTPAPWVNVLANPFFGSVISESGPSYTWGENAHEFRLSPWANDPVNDLRGEAFYLRDEEHGTFWSPTPAPCRGEAPYVTRHGFGYSVFEHTAHGIFSELRIYVAMDGAIKFSALKVRNVSDRPRTLSATGYVEWVLGDLRSKCSMHVVTEEDQESGALLARNPYNTEFPDRTAFFAVDDSLRHISGDRTEFIGRNGTLDAPAAMRRARLSDKVGAVLDPCAAIQVFFELNEGQEREIIFKLGVGVNPQDARSLLQRFAGAEAAQRALGEVWQHWTHALEGIKVETPDTAFNMLANGWLLYQSLGCRMWGRSASYQSGGAFGFRDQLQDAMALVHTRPDILRKHIVLCAAHQFPEGDVQHWWHPPLDRGVRTHCSDDYLWLPLAVCRYVQATGDTGLLEEQLPFIQGRLLKPDEESYYDLPGHTQETATLYAHCTAAVEHGLRFGEHGLPLMGTGDWNDGMDLVGAQGKGESVWLAFFLYKVLTDFRSLAANYGDALFAEHCGTQAAILRKQIAAHAWDGAWYRRAYFDDGTALGTARASECRIDSIAQSWAVLSGAGEAEKSQCAMESLYTHLVDQTHRILPLFTPPFDNGVLQPGYIKGYSPGTRENGGQYTHAAIWAGMAFAELGDAARAWEVLDMINPINHARNCEEVATYTVEPYVMAADVYAAPQHMGRGGWTWYTGSAAWMYRFMVESLLGITLVNNHLRFKPCIPAHWDSATVHYRFHETTYHITLTQQPNHSGTLTIRLDGVMQDSLMLDGVIHDGAVQEAAPLKLLNDGHDHWVSVSIA